MRDIYLVDFENVASDGLNGIINLSSEDEVIIFYSSNSNRLNMRTHILIERSNCALQYFEAAVGGKNALDHQIATWLGYLIGTHAAERNYYIVSRDNGYKYVTAFWAGAEPKASVFRVESVRMAAQKGQSQESSNSISLEAHSSMSDQKQLMEISELDEKAETTEEREDLVPESPRPRPRTNRTHSKYHRNHSHTPQNGTGDSTAASAQRKIEEKSDLPPLPLPEKQLGEVQNDTVPKETVGGENKTAAKDKEKSAPKTQRKGRTKAAPAAVSPNMDNLIKILSEHPDLHSQQLQELVTQNKKQALCNTLRKQLGQEKGLALYNEIKKSVW